MEICEFYVDEENKPQTNTIFQKTMDGKFTLNNPTKHLRDYLSIQGVVLPEDIFRTDTKNTNSGNAVPNVNVNMNVNHVNASVMPRATDTL